MNSVEFLEMNVAIDLIASQQGASSQPFDQDTQSECRFALATLGLRHGQAILDAPCGNGRHAFNLAARGLAVTGVDVSNHEKNAAPVLEEGAVAPKFLVSDIRDLKLVEQFDAVLSFYSFVGYFAERRSDDDAMAVLAASLRSGGHLLLGTANAHAIPVGSETNKFSFGDKTVLREDWLDSTQARLRRTLRIQDKNGAILHVIDHHRHMYSATALNALLDRHSFDLVARYSNYHFGEFSERHSRHQVVVAQKRGTASVVQCRK
jgi:SAM-dependent methyltransferase